VNIVRNLCIPLALLGALVLGGCVDDGDPTLEEATQASVGGYCESDCWCPLVSECDRAQRQCVGLIDFSPPPPGPLCGGTCQCGYGQTCFRGEGTIGYCGFDGGSCTSNCDCPHGTVCTDGVCGPDFGPFPNCYCNNHCGAGEVCREGHCITPRGGGGGGGGGAGGGQR